MKDGAALILKSIVGEKGLERLQKAIYRKQTQSVADPMELYLPLMVVPRAILSWLVQNIQPLKVGEYKDFRFPGKDDVNIQVEKQATDVYRGRVVQGGKVIHDFDKQSLPSVGGHLMTLFEQYDDLADKPVVMDRKEAVKEHQELVDALKSPSKEDDKEQLKQQSKELEQYKAGTEPSGNSSGLVRTIMNMNGISVESNEPGSVTAMMQLASIKALTESIGNLVDVLVARKVRDDMDKKEIKADNGKPKESEVPEPPKNKQGESLEQVRRDASKLDAEEHAKRLSRDYKCKDLKEGKEARDAEPVKKEEPPTAPKKPARSLRSQMGRFPSSGSYREKRAWAHRANDIAAGRVKSPKEAMDAAVAAIERHQSAPKKPEPEKKADLGDHPGSFMAPNEGMGKEEAVPTGPASMKTGVAKPKGFAMPVIKEELDKAGMGGAQKPAGAGMPRQNKMPAGPAKPVGPSNNPQAAHNQQAQGAMKQTMASGMGRQTAPAAGSINKPIASAPHMSTGKPKMAMKGEVAGYSTSSPAGKEIPAILDRPASRPKRHLRDLIKPPISKSEEHSVSESELYAKCEHCGVAEFKKSEAGPVFSPCACFVALTKDDEGKPTSFVALRKSADGYKLRFSPNADEDAKKAFLLLVKSRLLLKKRFEV